MNIVSLRRGDSPVLLAQPHGGTHIPDHIHNRLNEVGRQMEDTDWHIQRLYNDLLTDATVVTANTHRYVIDANRDPEDVSLYPGQNTTTLCPTISFDGKAIYNSGQEPSTDEIEQRRIVYHHPYHAVISEQLERVHQIHGFVILYDCHSIRSNIPHLFEGQLPVFNIGSNSGKACSDIVSRAVGNACRDAEGYNTVVNGRFKGGWTTRYYGDPDRGYHAIQMELAQRAYMQETAPWRYDRQKADALRRHLANILNNLANIESNP